MTLKKFDNYILDEKIKSEKIFLIDNFQNRNEIIDIKKALLLAKENNNNLIQIGINRQHQIPVCIIKDINKYIYENSKKLKKNNLKIQEKQFKIFININPNDLKCIQEKILKLFQKNSSTVKFNIVFKKNQFIVNSIDGISYIRDSVVLRAFELFQDTYIFLNYNLQNKITCENKIFTKYLNVINKDQYDNVEIIKDFINKNKILSKVISFVFTYKKS